MERQKSSTERASPTGSAQSLIFSRRRSYIPAAVPEVVRRRSWQPRQPAPQDLFKPKGHSSGQKNLGAICFEKSALQRPVWLIIRNLLLPSRLPWSDLGALAFGKTASHEPGRAFSQNILLLCYFICRGMTAPHIRLTDLIARIVRHAWLGSIAGGARLANPGWSGAIFCFAVKRVFRILVQTKISTL